MYNNTSSLENLSDDAAFGAFMLTFAGVALIICIISLVICLVFHIVRSIPLYILAKKAGRPYPWLAFIPIAQNYTFATIGEGPVAVPLIKKSIASRSAAFWIYIAVTFAPSIIVSIVSVIISLIPILGFILSFALSGFVSIAVAIISALFYYAFIQDIFTLYQPENGNNKTYAIICTVCTALGFSIVGTIFLYTMIKKTPVFPGEADTDAEIVSETISE